MSDPTYRIDVRLDLSSADGPSWSRRVVDDYPWKARVFRLSDDELVVAAVGQTRDECVQMATDLIRKMNEQAEPFSLYVDDDGRPVEGHSVKA